MKSFFVLCLAALLCVTLTGCPNDVKVETDYNHNVNFAQFRTFSFADVKGDNPFFQDRLEREVTQILQAKGLHPVASNGDLEITAVGAIHNRREYQTFYNNPGFGYYWWGGWGPRYTTTREINYQVGTLVLDMYDGQSKRLVWRGTATNTLDESSEKTIARLNAAIDKMLQHFPPQPNLPAS